MSSPLLKKNQTKEANRKKNTQMIQPKLKILFLWHHLPQTETLIFLKIIWEVI